MNLLQRRYQPDDYWRVRSFLREVYLLNDRRELSWQTYRFDYWRWHGIENIEHFRMEDVITLWETPAGQIAAVLHPKGRGEAFLQVHPAWRTPVLEAEMVTVATVPAQQRRGLGRAIMTEGLRRLQRVGATQATVGSYSVHAGALYASVGFTDYDLSERWTKTL